MDYLMPNPFLWNNVTIQTIAERIRGFMPFPRVFISLKVNIIARLEFELTHYDVAVQHRGIRGFMPFLRVLV